MVSMFKRRGSGKWILAWKDANGRRREKVAFRDKRASEQLKAKIERDLAHGSAGLLDPFEKHRKAPITDHLAGYRTRLESRGSSAHHVTQTMRRLLAAIGEMGAGSLADLEQGKADRFLLALMQTRSARTRDHYSACLRAFGSWLLDDDRWPLNPFHRCQAIATEADATFERRPLTYEELAKVCAAAEVRSLQAAARRGRLSDKRFAQLERRGRGRSVLYWTAAYTGLRANELRSLVWGDLELEVEVPHVLVRAATAKNRRTQRVPLHASLVALLRSERLQQAAEARRPIAASEAVLSVPKRVVQYLRADAAFAGVDVVDESGRRLDFHSLRGTCATLLVRAGVDMARAGEILRHSDPKITARVYAKLKLTDVSEGVAKLPDVPVPGYVPPGGSERTGENKRDDEDPSEGAKVDAG